MRKHVGDAEVQALACAYLRDVCGNLKLRAAVVAAGGVAAVVDTLSTLLPRSAVVTEVACSALCNMAQARGVAAEVLRGPALSLVYTALETYVKEAEVVECAMWVLWALALTAEGKAKLRATGAKGRVNTARRAHPNSTKVEASAVKVLVLLV